MFEQSFKNAPIKRPKKHPKLKMNARIFKKLRGDFLEE